MFEESWTFEECLFGRRHTEIESTRTSRRSRVLDRLFGRGQWTTPKVKVLLDVGVVDTVVYHGAEFAVVEQLERIGEFVVIDDRVFGTKRRASTQVSQTNVHVGARADRYCACAHAHRHKARRAAQLHGQVMHERSNRLVLAVKTRYEPTEVVTVHVGRQLVARRRHRFLFNRCLLLLDLARRILEHLQRFDGYHVVLGEKRLESRRWTTVSLVDVDDLVGNGGRLGLESARLVVAGHKAATPLEEVSLDSLEIAIHSVLRPQPDPLGDAVRLEQLLIDHMLGVTRTHPELLFGVGCRVDQREYAVDVIRERTIVAAQQSLGFDRS